jgi:hypothetical protein
MGYMALLRNLRNFDQAGVSDAGRAGRSRSGSPIRSRWRSRGSCRCGSWFTWNLAGYRHGHGAGATNRHTFGGLTDSSFKVISLLERHRDGGWPWG